MSTEVWIFLAAVKTTKHLSSSRDLHSVRNVWTGSIRDTCHAGTREAIDATASSIAVTATKIAGRSVEHRLWRAAATRWSGFDMRFVRSLEG